MRRLGFIHWDSGGNYQGFVLNEWMPAMICETFEWNQQFS